MGELVFDFDKFIHKPFGCVVLLIQVSIDILLGLKNCSTNGSALKTSDASEEILLVSVIFVLVMIWVICTDLVTVIFAVFIIIVCVVDVILTISLVFIIIIGWIIIPTFSRGIILILIFIAVLLFP